MRNAIRSLPISYSSPDFKTKQTNLSNSKTPPIMVKKCTKFEFVRFPLQKRDIRKNLSSSPFNKVQTIDSVIQELEQIATKDIRKYMGITQRDLAGKVNSLKAMTKLDVEEQIKERQRKTMSRKCIKAEEREIRMIIHRDTNKIRKYDKKE